MSLISPFLNRTGVRLCVPGRSIPRVGYQRAGVFDLARYSHSRASSSQVPSSERPLQVRITQRQTSRHGAILATRKIIEVGEQQQNLFGAMSLVVGQHSRIIPASLRRTHAQSGSQTPPLVERLPNRVLQRAEAWNSLLRILGKQGMVTECFKVYYEVGALEMLVVVA
jgi:pentatricopeptide repeat protein